MWALLICGGYFTSPSYYIISCFKICNTNVFKYVFCIHLKSVFTTIDAVAITILSPLYRCVATCDCCCCSSCYHMRIIIICVIIIILTQLWPFSFRLHANNSYTNYTHKRILLTRNVYIYTYRNGADGGEKRTVGQRFFAIRSSAT